MMTLRSTLFRHSPLSLVFAFVACVPDGQAKEAFRHVAKLEMSNAFRLTSSDWKIPERTALLGVDGLFGLEITNWTKGDFTTAISNLTEIIRITPNDAMAYIRRGICHSLQSEPDKAIADFKKATRVDPNNGLAHFFLGISHFEQREFERAITDITEALRLIPKKIMVRSRTASATLYSMRGYAYLATGAYERAVSDLTEAIKIDSRDDSFYCDRGTAYDRKGEFVKAMKDYDEAIRINPTNLVAYYNRGCIGQERGELDSAIRDFTRAIQIDPTNVDSYYNRSVAFSDKGALDKAIADLNEAIRLEPHNGTFYCDRGHVFSRKEEWTKARADYSEAIRVDPNNADAHNELAWLLATSPDASVRNGVRAIAIAKRACELAEWKNPNHIGTLAAANAEAGDFEEAVKYQKQVLSSTVLNKTERSDETQRLELFQQRKPYRDEAK
ncbi:MAG TPA: tetratricopeptide repeat protein [Candidatus Limnocylindria bacterium]|nr:tetratricopeptide repeat protein [Candidatus Limnocylindria bacterium]